MEYQELTHLKELESESIFILREITFPRLDNKLKTC